MKLARSALLFIPLAGLVLLVIWLLRPKHDLPNVILISIDTLRADHLGCYGYDRNTSPNLDDLAEESILFTKNFAPSSTTTPSHVSMLTSLYPLAHDVLSNRESQSYSEDIIPLTQILKDNGYKTAGFVGGAGVSKIKGFSRGFDFWSEGRYILAHFPEVKEWLSTNREGKFFLFFHFYDVHAPYVFRENYTDMYHNIDYYKDLISRIEKITSVESFSLDYYDSLTDQEKFDLLVSRLIQEFKRKPEEGVEAAAQREIFARLEEWSTFPDYGKQIQLLVDSYDAGIKYTDHKLGEFFSFLKSRGLWENTMLVVTSDHGEEFMEHNMVTHGINLYDTLIHVPLIIKMPEISGKKVKRVSHLSEIVDIMPTILDVLGVKFAGQMQGKSLIPLIYNGENNGKDAVFASVEIGDSPKKRSIRTDFWKYIIFDMDYSESDEFYNLENDGSELRNLISEKKKVGRQLKGYLSDHIRDCLSLYNAKYSQRRKAEDDYPEEVRKKQIEILRALGYVH
jgi:arylsulfatase A-like enzyme